MTSYQSSVQSYNRPPEAGSPRRTEAWALIEAARRMAEAIGDGEDANASQNSQRKDALRLNWRLWTIFQAELVEARSEVPEEIRVNMLTLCNFVDKHTVATLVEPTASRLRTLIDINRNIALGLLSIEEEMVKAAGEKDSPVTQPAESPRLRVNT